jgi:hypothetical protein
MLESGDARHYGGSGPDLADVAERRHSRSIHPHHRADYKSWDWPLIKVALGPITRTWRVYCVSERSERLGSMPSPMDYGR